MELSTAFQSFVASIQPPAARVSAAKAAHERVREQLRTDEEAKQAHQDTFLSGSYARSTAVGSIKDVDVICLLDIDHTITPPEVVLAWMQGILSKHYANTKRQGRSVGFQAAKDMWVDVVPSSLVASEGGPLWIPDREAREWVVSHPKGQIAAALNQNKVTNGYYVQVVKLLKFWRDRLPRESCRPASYILETLVHRTIGYPASHAAAVAAVLEGIQRTCGAFRGTNSVPVIPDPGHSSVNVAKRWSSAEFDDFMAQVEPASTTARDALNETDEAESRRLWRRLFGPTFGA